MAETKKTRKPRPKKLPPTIPPHIAAQIEAQRRGELEPAAPIGGEEATILPAPAPAEVQLDELDALRLSRLVSRRALGELRIAKLEQETELIAAQANAQIAELGRQVRDLVRVVGEEKGKERRLLEELAAKHKIDPLAYTFHEDAGRLVQKAPQK